MAAGVLAAVLIIWSVIDIKKRSLSLGILLSLGLVMAVSSVLAGNIAFSDRLCGVAVGALVMAASFATRGQVGMGDGILLCFTGFAAGGEAVLLTLLIASFVAGLFSALMLILKKLTRKDRFAFAPFIAAGYLGVIILYA